MSDLQRHTRERMERLGIPQGTDDPLLLALGAKPFGVCKKHEESLPCSVCELVREVRTDDR